MGWALVLLAHARALDSAGRRGHEDLLKASMVRRLAWPSHLRAAPRECPGLPNAHDAIWRHRNGHHKPQLGHCAILSYWRAWRNVVASLGATANHGRSPREAFGGGCGTRTHELLHGNRLANPHERLVLRFWFCGFGLNPITVDYRGFA